MMKNFTISTKTTRNQDHKIFGLLQKSKVKLWRMHRSPYRSKRKFGGELELTFRDIFTSRALFQSGFAKIISFFLFFVPKTFFRLAHKNARCIPALLCASSPFFLIKNSFRLMFSWASRKIGPCDVQLLILSFYRKINLLIYLTAGVHHAFLQKS